MLYTYINRHAGTPDKTKQNRLIVRAYSLEHKERYDVVIGEISAFTFLQTSP